MPSAKWRQYCRGLNVLRYRYDVIRWQEFQSINLSEILSKPIDSGAVKMAVELMDGMETGTSNIVASICWDIARMMVRIKTVKTKYMGEDNTMVFGKIVWQK